MKLKRSSYHWCSYHILMFFISHLWSGIDSELVAGYSINATHRVTVQRGLCVYIPCRFIVPETENLTTDAVGFWINTNEVIVTSKRERNDQFFSNGRFFLVGDVRRGDCSLYIEDPLHDDGGHYRFRVEDKIKFSYLDIQPYVEVTDLTDKPEISPIKSWLDGEEVTLTCTSPGRCKRIIPQIIWEGNSQNTRVENQTSNHENGTKTHFSTITFTARKEQNNSTLSCIVQLRAGLTTVQQININVEYSPRKIEGNISMCLKVENRIECTCIIQSLPKPTAMWKINGKSINNLNNTEVNISTVTSNSVTNSTLTITVNMEESRNIQCVASNVHGELVQELFNETVHPMSEAFPAAAIYGGCFAAVLLVIGILLILFYRKRKMMQKKEKSRQSHVSVADPIYGNSEMFPNGPHEVGPISQEDHQPPPEDNSVDLNCQDMQYMSVDFSKLKQKVATETEEIEYAVVKRTN